MDESGPSRGELASLAALLAVYAVALWLYFVPVLGSPDANCYHLSARQLAEQGQLHQRVEDPLAYVGHLWLRTETGDYYPKYPPVYPALAAGAQRLFGHPAGLYVNVLAAWLAVLFTYAAARSFLPGWASVLAAALQATGPAFNSMAIDQIAHAPSVAALAGSAALFLHAVRNPVWNRARTSLRRPAGLALAFALSGLLMGCAGGIRYTNVLLALPFGLWLAARWWRAGEGRPQALGQGLAWAAGLALPWAAVAWYHLEAFGSPLRTAYSLTAEQTAFSLEYFGRNLGRYAHGLWSKGFGPALALVPVGLAIGLGVHGRRLFYLAWVLPLTLLYLAYYYAPESQVVAYVRFLLPLQLPVVLLAVAAVARMADRIPNASGRAALVGLFALVQLGWGVRGSLHELELRHSFNHMVQQRVDFVRGAVPAGSMIFATRWLLDDLDYHVDRAGMDRKGGGRHLYENDLVDQVWLTRVVGQFLEKASIQRERVERVRELLVDVPLETFQREVGTRIEASLDAGRGVYLVGTANVRSAFEANFSERFALVEVATLPALRPHHPLMRLERAGDLAANPAWGESSILRVERR